MGVEIRELPAARNRMLRVTCWCEQHIVNVLQADVVAGKTTSCDENECRDQ